MFAHVFRNSLVASGLLIGTSLLIAPTALAQVNSGGAVTGGVAPINVLTFTPTTGTAITAGQAVSAYPIGTLAIQNNSGAGWTLGVASANGGRLINGVHSIVYTGVTSAAIDGATITPVNLATAATPEQMITADYSNTVAAGVTGRTVTAAIAASQYVPAGTYSDTLTFTLTSK